MRLIYFKIKRFFSSILYIFSNRVRSVKKTPVLKIGVKNLNDRIYTKEEVEKIVDQFNKKVEKMPFYGQVGYPDAFNTSIKNISHHTTNLVIEGDTLYADVNGMHIQANQSIIDFAMEQLKNGGAVLRPRSSGIVKPDGTVEIAQLFAFDIIPASEDSFKGIIV